MCFLGLQWPSVNVFSICFCRLPLAVHKLCTHSILWQRVLMARCPVSDIFFPLNLTSSFLSFPVFFFYCKTEGIVKPYPPCLCHHNFGEFYPSPTFPALFSTLNPVYSVIHTPRRYFIHLAEMKAMMTIISCKKSSRTLWIKNSDWDMEHNSVKNSSMTMTSVSLLATFSTIIVSEFASHTGLMRDSSQSYPLWKSKFFHLEKREERCCFTWLFINRSNIVKICWVFRTILYLSSKNIYLIFFFFQIL